MANLVLSSKNALDSGVSWYGQADGGFPLTNLADSNFSKVWRYTPGTNADGNSARFAFSLNPVLRASHVAFCGHNLGEHAQIRVKAGMARFDFDATTDNPLIHDITFGGGTNGTRTNEYGVMVAGTCPRYEHDRRYFDNGFKYSEDLSQSVWGGESDGGIKKYADGKTVEFAKVSGNFHLYQTLNSELYAVAYEVKAQVRLVSGDASFALHIHDGSTSFTGSTETATTAWQWFSATLTPTTAGHINGLAGIKKISAAGVLQIRKLQISRGSSNGKYRKTTNQRRYQRIGVITEAAATNSLLHSAALDNAVWVKTNFTVGVDSGVAPDGTTSMDTLTATAANADVLQDLALGGTTARALSFFFRPAGSTSTAASLRIVWRTGGVEQSVTCTFNPATGAFISSSAIGATLRAAGVKDVGGGYFRAYLMGVGADALNTSVRSQLIVGTSGQTCQAWGFQNESTYVTTYIPTTTAAVTRTLDTAVVEPVTWVPYAWNAAEGTVYHESMVDEILSGQVITASQVEAFSAGTNIFRTASYDNSTSVGLAVDVYNGGVVTATINTAGYSRGTAHRIAARYRANDVAASFDGAAVGTDTTTAIPAVTTIDLMNVPKATAYLRRVTIWPTGKSNTELQALATSGPSAIDYDSGWDDALQMSMAGDVPSTWGKDYDIIKTFAARAVEWVRVELYDPAKVSSSFPFDIGRAFMGKLTLQPTYNAEYGLGDAWIDRDTFTETRDGRRFFNDAAAIREVSFSFPHLTLAEGRKLHEIQGSGKRSSEVLYLPDPDDEAECQRMGMVGLMEKLDPLMYPMVDTRATNLQIRKKR